MTTRRICSLLTTLTLTAHLGACGDASNEPSDDNTSDGDGVEATESAEYDLSLLEEYKQALPSEEQLTAEAPGPEPTSNALTLIGDAELGGMAAKSARDINSLARGIVWLMRTVTALPPTLYDSEKQEFIWGPWDNDEGHGQVLVFITKNDPDDDFEYGYALVRLDDRDLEKAQAVVWGGATPDPDDERHGAGITLWDFEANHEFEKAYDPDYDPDAARDEGRFAMVYGRDDGDDGEYAFNVAVFRDFVSKGDEDAEPVDLDYYFGHLQGDDGNVIDFLDWSLSGDMCGADPESCFEEPSGVSETLGLRAAFINRGMGRAEAVISGGDLEDMIEVSECWDDAVDRTYFGVSQNGEMLAEEGLCLPPFASTLEQLGVPTLADVDPEGLAAMDCVASNGLEACIDDED